MSKVSRIDQILPCYAGRDAIGLHTLNINMLLAERGIIGAIFAEGDSPFTRGTVGSLDSFDRVASLDSAVIHHYSVGSSIPCRLIGSPAFKITCYHNITPPRFFSAPGDEGARDACRSGLSQAALIRLSTDVCWADSKFNAAELVEQGFEDSLILPILRNYEALSKKTDVPSLRVSMKKGGAKNLLFVGRVAPNKSAHDLMIMLKHYKSFIDPNIRLILAGAAGGIYPQIHLKELALGLGLKIAESLSDEAFSTADVIMTGSISDEELATLYRNSDAFICLSEHEGFCVPLVEAMFFGIPILAHDATAVPETLGAGGLLIDKSDVVQTMSALKAVLTDETVKSFYKNAAIERSRDFSWDVLVKTFDQVLAETLRIYNLKRMKRGPS